MTLMTDDIEWYPLPEVEEDEAPVEMAPSNNTLSSTASHSSAISTALSQSYLTPASSVSSCRSDSNPHVTGTIQPYLKRAPGQVQRRNTKEDHSGPVSSDSTESVDNQHRTSSTLSASRRGTGRRRATTGTAKQTCVQRQSSSTVSFKTAKASSTVSLRTNKSASSFQTAPSSVSLKTSKSRESSKTTASSTSLQSPRCLDTAESLNTESSQAAHSMQSVATSTGVSSTTAGHNLHPPTLSGPQDLSPGSTLTSPALSQCERDSQQNTPTETIPVTGLPSRVFMTGVQLPPGKQKETISLVELDQLWMDFLASSLGAQQPEKRSLVRRPAAHTALQPTTCGSGEESLREQCSFETRDTAIQTTPSLALSSKPIAFGVTSHQNQHTFQQQLQSPRLSHLTLQESLKILRPDFVRHSEQRQRALKRNQELHSHQCRAAGSRYPRQEESHRSPHFILIDVTKNRPKMSPAEMYRNSKKYWCKLPEVQQKVQEQRRESDAATNRLRMKLYQQEVLGRLRKKRK